MGRLDILVRFFVTGYEGQMPDLLHKRLRREDDVDSSWAELREDPEHSAQTSDSSDTDPEKLPGYRVIDSLRNASVLFLLEDLVDEGYVLSRVHVHRHTPGFIFILGFSHRSNGPDTWKNTKVVDWILRQFVGMDVDNERIGLVTALIPHHTGQDHNHAILVNCLQPDLPKNAPPVFNLRFEGGDFWIQGPKDAEFGVGEANHIVACHKAPGLAVQEIGKAANACLRAGGSIKQAKLVSLRAAYWAFRALESMAYGLGHFNDEDGRFDLEVFRLGIMKAQGLARAAVDDVNWDRKAKKFGITIETDDE